MSDLLHKPIDYLKGVGPNRAQLLRQDLNIQTVQDLLYFFPNRYIDRSQHFTPSSLPQTTAEVQVVGSIIHLETVKQKKGSRLVATFSDGQNTMELVWFRGQQWIQKSLQLNKAYVAFGRLNWFGKKCSIAHPELVFVEEHEQRKGNFQAVYPSTESLVKSGISQRVIRQIMVHLFNELGKGIQEVMSPTLLQQYRLMDKHTALRHIHFPDNQELLAQAQYRMKFEELFFMQLQLGLKKRNRKIQLKGIPFPALGNYFNTFYHKHLPFALTEAQKRVIREIRTDLKSEAQMNRLLQGDVGAGKTLVAFMALLVAVEAGGQGVMMAPTEILARQHIEGLAPLARDAGIRLALLTGRDKGAERREKLAALAAGEIDVLVGTHAVFQKDVVFHDLRLSVIDEQHRFGVRQRLELGQKGVAVDVLVMTATPIPRSLALAHYGDMDVSVLDEKPPGRKPITTALVATERLDEVVAHLARAVADGRQAYWVCPLVEESEVVDLIAAEDRFQRLRAALGEGVVGLVHGQMPPAEKDAAMAAFQRGDTQVLVATTVIEVGVNVPNATIMVIERAEIFGLAQLHQLRGRVGRGSQQSTCLLLYQAPLGEGGRKRLTTLRDTEDGFRIAEVDLEMRGAGDLSGTAQSGLLRFRVADLERQAGLMAIAQSDARKLLADDPALTSPRGQAARLLLWLMEQDQAIRLISVG